MANHDHDTPHITGLGTYFAVFGALMVLTAATVFVAFQDLGMMNNVVALGIATLKAVLVLWFFMHLGHATTFTRVAMASTLFFFFLLLAFLFGDTLTRDLLDVPGRVIEL